MYAIPHALQILYPMGDRGGTATVIESVKRKIRLYPMGDRGGTATLNPIPSTHPQLYPMGDRGGTATAPSATLVLCHYTRWEIGGEPQPYG